MELFYYISYKFFNVIGTTRDKIKCHWYSSGQINLKHLQIYRKFFDKNKLWPSLSGNNFVIVSFSYNYLLLIINIQK